MADLPPSKRIRLLRTLNALPPSIFNEVVFALDVSDGVMPGKDAPQGDRASALAEWAGSSVGCGLAKLKRIVDEIVTHYHCALPLIQEYREQDLIDLLYDAFEQHREMFLRAYRPVIPSRRINPQWSADLPAIISDLFNWSGQESGEYSSPELFVGCLLVSNTLSLSLQTGLKDWLKEGGKDTQAQEQLCQTVEPLRREDTPCSNNGGLLVAVSERQDDYVVEAWVIKDIEQCDEPSLEYWGQIQLDETGTKSLGEQKAVYKTEFQTDRELSNLPHLLQTFVHWTLDKRHHHTSG